MSTAETAVADESLSTLLSDEERADAAILTLKESAAILRISIALATKLARSGELPGVLPRIGNRGKWYVSKKVLFEYLRSASSPEPSARAG